MTTYNGMSIEEMGEVITNCYDRLEIFTDWEVDFIENTMKRFETYNEKTFISQVQADVIIRLADKLEEQDAS